MGGVQLALAQSPGSESVSGHPQVQRPCFGKMSDVHGTHVVTHRLRVL